MHSPNNRSNTPFTSSSPIRHGPLSRGTAYVAWGPLPWPPPALPSAQFVPGGDGIPNQSHSPTHAIPPGGTSHHQHSYLGPTTPPPRPSPFAPHHSHPCGHHASPQARGGGKRIRTPSKTQTQKTQKTQINANKRKKTQIVKIKDPRCVTSSQKHVFWIPLNPNLPKNIWLARKNFDFDQKMTKKVAFFGSFFPKFSADAETAKSQGGFHRKPQNRLWKKNAKNAKKTQKTQIFQILKNAKKRKK